MKKRLLSILLVISVLFSVMIPGFAVYAEGLTGEDAVQITESITESASPEDAESEYPVDERIKENVNENVDKVGSAALLSEEAPTDGCDFSALFSAKLFVAADASAGLEGRVYADFAPLSCSGTVYLPGSADTGALFLSWDDEALTLSRRGTVYVSGTAPIAPAGETICYRVTRGSAVAVIALKTVKGSPDVAGMFLTLDESLGTIDAMNSDPIHETSCYGTVGFDGELYPYMSMKGRGNSTWDFAKKPYNLTFYKAGDYDKKQKTELIPGVKAKKWSLLANYLDPTLIRNKIGLDLASELGIGLESRFVDLWMNGEYLGNYLLTPKNDYDAPDGGYVLENDNYLSDDPQFELPGMHAPSDNDGFLNLMSVKDIGDDAADAGETPETIEAYFLEAWDALRDYDSEEYQNYFDIDSWAKQYLMYEVTKTYDVFSGSLLMHRDGLTAEDKIIAGPAWDMDNAFGRTIIKFLSGVGIYNQLSAEGWYVDSVGYIVDDRPVSLLQELSKHASFKQRISEIYNEYLWAFEGILADIDAQSAVIKQSADMDYERWGTLRLSLDITPVPVIIGSGEYIVYYEPTLTWNSYLNNLRSFVTKRVQYMSDRLCVDIPEGEITGETELQSGDTLELTAELTAGIGSNAFQWQSKVKKGEWCDIDGATDKVLKLTVAESDNGTKYRCVVNNFGGKINMQHGKSANASAQTVLDSVSISVTAHKHSYEAQIIEPTCTEGGCTKYVCRCGDFYIEDKVPAREHTFCDGFCIECGAKDPAASFGVKKEAAQLSEGKLTMVMNKKELGEFTFKEVNGGWTICDGDGLYLAVEGKNLVRSDTPFVWKYSNGVFSASVRLSFTKLGEWLGISHTDHVYLTESKGAPALSLILGTKASFTKTVEYFIG